MTWKINLYAVNDDYNPATITWNIYAGMAKTLEANSNNYDLADGDKWDDRNENYVALAGGSGVNLSGTIYAIAYEIDFSVVPTSGGSYLNMDPNLGHILQQLS